jgi:hypothetical protein
MMHWRGTAACVAVLLLFAGCRRPQPAAGKMIRTQEEVDAAGRNALRRYEDQRLASWGILDVTRAPYSADAAGKSDSTAALQRAPEDARDARSVAFLPAGTYLVSDTLTCIQGVVRREGAPLLEADPFVTSVSDRYPCVLIGPPQGERAVIVLAGRASGFGDPAQPKPVVHFWARSVNENNADPSQPQPNISFGQVILGVDFRLGEGNTGAMAIDHQAARPTIQTGWATR